MPRAIPKNRKPRYCPACGGTMVKKGKPGMGNFYKRQEWGCQRCGRRTQFPKMQVG